MNQQDYDEIQQEIERQLAEEEQNRARQQRVRQQQQAEADAASTSEQSNQDAEASTNESNEGIFTRLGQGLDKFSEGGYAMDATSALAGLAGKDLPNYEEYKEIEDDINQRRRDRLDANVGTFGDNVVLGGEALSEGVTAGVLAPVTIAGRVTNQDTPWSRAPKAIKDHALYDTIFQVTEVMVPSLILGGVAGPAVGGTTGLVAESALETALQDDLGETITGELLADNLGKIATSLGHDGELLAQNLKDGKRDESKALTAVVGFMENLGINFGVNQVFKKFSKGTDVYHGTMSAEAIRSEGFKLSVNKENSGALGSGVYVSTDKPYAEFFAGQGKVKLDGGEVLSGEMKRLRFKKFGSYQSFAKWVDKQGIDFPDDGLFPPGTSLSQYLPGFDGIQVKGGAIPELSKSGMETVIFDPKKANEVFGINPSALVDEVTERSSKLGNETAEQAQKNIDNTTQPAYSPDFEPSEVIDIDSVVPTSLPTKGNQYISHSALQREMLRDVGILDDGLTSAQRSYFSNYKPLAKETGIQKVIEEVTKALKKLPEYPSDLATATLRAETFWNENKNLIDENLDDLVIKFADKNEEMVRTLDDRWEVVRNAFPSSAETRLRDGTATTPAGDIAGALIGEELGIKIQKQALAVTNLENADIDFTDAVNTLVDLQEVAENFFIPLRRARRQWAIAGKTKQRKTIESIQDAMVVDPNAQKPATLDSAASNFTRIRKDDTDVGKTLREIWDAAQAGDEDALQTLKDYVNYIAYTDPRNVMEQVDNLSRNIADQWAKGNTKATSNLFYGFMLSRVSTQVASIASNISRLALEPVGAVLSGEQAYGFGQLVGGLAHWQEALSVGRRAFAKNQQINGGRKVGSASIASLKGQQMQIARDYQKLKEKLIKNGQSTFALDRQYELQMAGTNPLVHAGGRFLLAADEMTKSLVASQIATGRAFKEAAELSAKPGAKKIEHDSYAMKKLVHKHFNDIYLDGVKTGKIKKQDVLDAAQNISFQRDIPSGPDASVFDNLASAVETGAKNSAAMRFFAPFTRVSWNIAETANRLGVGVGYSTLTQAGKIPVGKTSLGDITLSTPVGRWAADNMFPRYQAILNGKDEAAKIQLKSQFALGQATAVSAVGLASMGMLTGYNSGQLPQTSILVPAPGTTTGYIAINYSKLEPFASLLAFTADGVNSFRYGAISRGEYSKVVEEVIFSFGMSTLNKTFLTGIADLGEILNIKNMNKGSAATLASSIASLSAPAAVRMVGQILYPYKTLQQNDGSLAETMLARINARATGGVFNPEMYSPLTGKKVPRAATIGGDGYWNAVLGSLVNEFGFPGKVNGVDAKDPVVQKLNEIGFEYDSYSSIRNVNGVALSLQEQSILARDMGDPEIGNLHGNLKYYFDTVYDGDNGKKKEFENARKAAGGEVIEGTDAHKILQEIRADIRSIYQDVKQLAASEGELGTGDKGQSYRQKIVDKQISTGANPNDKIPGAEGLVAWANGQISISQVG